MCSLCWSLHGLEVNAKHPEKAQMMNIMALCFFIYLNPVKTSHLPSFLFNLQETEKNRSGFRRCADPMMCTAVTPTYILLLIAKTEIHPAALRDTRCSFPYTKYISNSTAISNYHPRPQTSTVETYECITSLFYHFWEISMGIPKRFLQHPVQSPKQRIFPCHQLIWSSLLILSEENKPVISVYKMSHFPAVPGTWSHDFSLLLHSDTKK